MIDKNNIFESKFINELSKSTVYRELSKYSIEITEKQLKEEEPKEDSFIKQALFLDVVQSERGKKTSEHVDYKLSPYGNKFRKMINGLKNNEFLKMLSKIRRNKSRIATFEIYEILRQEHPNNKIFQADDFKKQFKLKFSKRFSEWLRDQVSKSILKPFEFEHMQEKVDNIEGILKDELRVILEDLSKQPENKYYIIHEDVRLAIQTLKRFVKEKDVDLVDNDAYLMKCLRTIIKDPRENLQSIYVVSREGLIVSSIHDDDISDMQVAAMSAIVLSTSERLLMEKQLKYYKYTLLECENQFIVFMPVGYDFMLTAVVKKNEDEPDMDNFGKIQSIMTQENTKIEIVVDEEPFALEKFVTTLPMYTELPNIQTVAMMRIFASIMKRIAETFNDNAIRIILHAEGGVCEIYEIHKFSDFDPIVVLLTNDNENAIENAKKTLHSKENRWKDQSMKTITKEPNPYKQHLNNILSYEERMNKLEEYLNWMYLSVVQ
ncbi:MAG: hypothetical protein GF364_13180 [Candidatus Lokiarchaeota archaeon]|nr:hypothetical protein [Candidatus Lokiarchaeota archaeon]